MKKKSYSAKKAQSIQKPQPNNNYSNTSYSNSSNSSNSNTSYINNNYKTYLIGPSSLHNEYTTSVEQEIKEGILFKDCHLNGHKGMPNWSKRLYDNIKKEYASGKQVVWVVSDYELNNVDYDAICSKLEGNVPQNTSELFFDVTENHNISNDFTKPNHISTLGFYTINIIDKIVKDFPNIKLLFWNLYAKSRVHTSSYPVWMQYNSLKKRYANNIVDIDLYTSPEVFSTFIKDASGLPNKEGYFFLDKIINNPSHSARSIIINHDLLSGKKCDFLRGNGSLVCELQLNNDGSIGLYSNPNEKSWAIKNTHVCLLSDQNKITTDFSRYEIHNNTLYLVGNFVLHNSKTKHILRTKLN